MDSLLALDGGITAAPFGLTPVCGSAEFGAGTAEVASAAAQPCGAPGIGDCSACLAGSSGLVRRRRSGGNRSSLAFPEAWLAHLGTAVDVLILNRILGTAMAFSTAATVVVPVDSSAWAAHTTLGTTTNIDIGDDVHRGLRLARRAGARERRLARIPVTMSWSGVTPSCSAAALFGATFSITVFWTAVHVLGHDNHSQTRGNKNGETHDDWCFA